MYKQPKNPNYDYDKETESEHFSDNSAMPAGVDMEDWEGPRPGMVESYDITNTKTSDQLGREKSKHSHKRLGDYGGLGENLCPITKSRNAKAKGD